MKLPSVFAGASGTERSAIVRNAIATEREPHIGEEKTVLTSYFRKEEEGGGNTERCQL